MDRDIHRDMSLPGLTAGNTGSTAGGDSSNATAGEVGMAQPQVPWTIDVTRYTGYLVSSSGASNWEQKASVVNRVFRSSFTAADLSERSAEALASKEKAKTERAKAKEERAKKKAKIIDTGVYGGPPKRT